MKDYLPKSRTRTFDGTLSLLKKVLLPNLVLNIIMSLIFLSIFIPLIMSSFGWSASRISEFNEQLLGIGQSGGTRGNPRQAFSGIFVDFAFGFLIIALVVGLIMFSWMYFTYLKPNAHEIRERNNGILHALTHSFSSRIWTILAYIMVFILVGFIIYLIYFQFVALVFSISKFGGIMTGFLGFFMMMVFFMRFIIVIPAIVHGNKSIFGALKFSYKTLKFKWSGLLLILGLVFTVILWLVMCCIFFLMSFLFESGEGESRILSFIIVQILFVIIGAAIGAFLYSSLRALYFRYRGVEEPVGNGER